MDICLLFLFDETVFSVLDSLAVAFCDVISAVIGFPSLISQLPGSQWQLPHTVAAVDTDVERLIMKTLRINAGITR